MTNSDKYSDYTLTFKVPLQKPREKLIFTLEAGKELIMNSMKLVIPLHSLYWSIHTKDESKRGTAFAFIFGVN